MRSSSQALIVFVFLIGTGFKVPCQAASIYMANVTDINGVTLQIEDIRLVEHPTGYWVGGEPTQDHQMIWYRIEKNGVQIVRSVAFADTTSIEFQHSTANEPDILIKLKDGSQIRILILKHIAEKTTKLDEKTVERCISSGWILSSGQEVQSQVYIAHGFKGYAKVDGDRGKRFRKLEEIRKIEFVSEGAK